MSEKKYLLEEIKELHNNLKELQTEFQKKCLTLEGRLDTLIRRVNDECVEAPLCSESIHASDAIITAKQEVREPKEIRSTQSIQEHEEHKQPPAYISNAVELDEDRQTRKGIVKIALQALFFSFFPMILAPLLSLYTRIKEIIAHYRRQGKLAVFFMTLAGIIALVLGVGYILQYSFIHLLGPISKLSLCFVGSLMICALGIRLSLKEKGNEYASALIGASIVLNYLVIYFMALYYALISAYAGFSLLIVNTLVGYFLARVFETRIVAVISFIGGSLTPFILNMESVHPAFYIYYLFVLALSTLHVAHHIQWPHLAHASFLIIAAITEYIVCRTSYAPNIHLVCAVHSIFYLYSYHSLFKGKNIKKHLTLTSILLLTGNISLLLFNVSHLIHNSRVLGLLLLLNSLPFISLEYIAWERLVDKQRTVLITISATFIALAIPTLFNLSIMALFWAQEGFLLIFMGFLFSLPFVRKEGYAVLTIAFIQIIYLQRHLLSLWPGIFSSSPYWNGVACGVILMVIIVLLKKHKKAFTPLEKRLFIIFEELFSLWVLCAFIVTSAALIPSWFLPLCLLPALYVMYRAWKHTLMMSRVMGAFLVYTAISIVLMRQFFLIPLWPDIFSSPVYLNVIAASIILWFAIFLLKKSIVSLDAFYKSFYIILQESFSFIIALEFMITMAALSPQWFLCWAIVPMAYIIYRGKVLNLPYSQYIGTGLYLLLLAEIYSSYSSGHSFLFVKQTPSGKVAMIETFALLWIYQLYLEKIKGAHILLSLGRKLRLLFYLLIPLTFLQHINIYYHSFLPLALWVSSMTAYLLQKIIKEKIVRGEFFILSLIAALVCILAPFVGSGATLVSPLSAALLTGTLFCGFLLWYEGAFHRSRFKAHPLKIFFIGSWMYFCAFLFLMVHALTSNLQLSLLASGIFFVFLIQYQPLFPSVRPLYGLFYQAGKLFIVISIVFCAQSTVSFTHYSLIRSTISLCGIGSLLFLIYFKPHVYRLLRYNNRKQKKLTIRTSDLWMFHILIAVVSINSLLIMNNTLTQPLISIFILMHAIFLLFHARYPSYHSLNKLALLLFIGVISKVLLFDMVGFTIFQKIIALMIMAAILLGAAYVLQKQNLLQPHGAARIPQNLS